MSEHPISEFIRQLDIAGKSISMYSESHPSAKGALEQAYALLQEPLQSRSAVNLNVIGSDILIDGEPVKRGERVIERFLKTLDNRGVRSLTFVRECTMNELIQMLQILNYTPQRIRDFGGIETVFEKEKLTGIQVNKVKYGIIDGNSATPAGSVAMSMDEGLLAQLLSNIQVGSAPGEISAVARNVETSLEGSSSSDASAVLFRMFQNMASGAVVDQTRPLREQFLDMYRSFTPKMQGKIFLTSVLNHALLEKSSLNGFYYELRPEELESPIMAILLLEQVSEQDLKSFTARLLSDEKIVLTENIRQRLTQQGLLQPLPPPPPAPELDDLRKKPAPDVADYPKLVDFIRQDIQAGNLEEADRVSKKILAGMNAANADQRAAAVRSIGPMVEELSKNDKWKNVETSLSFLIANHFRKEPEDAVLESYAEYIASGFRKKYAAREFPAAREVVSLLLSRGDKKMALASGIAGELTPLHDLIRADLREAGAATEAALEYLKSCGDAGAHFLLEWLAEEEDQRVRSRIISYTEKLDQSCLLPEMEKRLEDTRWYVVRNMVTISGRLNLPNSVPFMTRAMKNEDIRVAKEVVKALFKSVTTANSPLVMELLQHEDKSIRLQALRLTTLFGLEKGQARAALQKMASSDPVPEVRTLASSILG